MSCAVMIVLSCNHHASVVAVGADHLETAAGGGKSRCCSSFWKSGMKERMSKRADHA